MSDELDKTCWDSCTFRSGNYDACESRVRLLFADIVWTQKIHEKQADILENKYRRVTTTSVVLTAIAGCGILASAFSQYEFMQLGSFALTAASLYFSILGKCRDYSGMAAENARCARRFLALREQSLNILTCIKFRELSALEICKGINSIAEQYAKECDNSPRTTFRAKKIAEKAIGAGETTYCEEDLNSLLPEYLKDKK